MATDKQYRSKVLLIDDDTSLLLMLSDFLKFEGYDVVTADAGEEGLKRLESMKPDLIILDMSMPGMGGIGFLKAISLPGGRPKFPVLVLTARANMAEFFADVEVDGFIAKPCNTEDLLNEVGRIVFLRRGEEGNRPSAGATKAKLLVGEDDPAIMTRLVRELGGAGYIVETASSGPEVMERAIVGRPAAILCKLVLRAMNGDGVANMLKEMPNTSVIPVILYDDSGSAGSADSYRKTGAHVEAVVIGNASETILAAIAKVLA